MSTTRVSPAPLFDVSAYELEHRPSIDRQDRIQKAALAERQDTAIPAATRRLHLRRAARWIETLIQELEEEDA